MPHAARVAPRLTAPAVRLVASDASPARRTVALCARAAVA
jgi:hypothetical protein